MMNYCDSCGGMLHYSAKNKGNKCDNCGAVYPVENVFSFEKNAFDESFLLEKAEKSPNYVENVKCTGCGANVELTKYQLTANCPYCGKMLKAEKAKQKLISVDSIIPFYFTKEQAFKKLKMAINTHFNVDKKAFKNLKPEDVKGEYINIFAFDMNVLCRYSGIFKFTEKDSDGEGFTTSQKSAVGMVDELFKDIVVEANSHVEQPEIFSIMPFDFNSAYMFSEDFMQGYSLEKQDKPFRECVAMAEKIIKNRLENTILRRHNADSIETINMQIDYSNRKYNYCLVPVYVVETATKVNKKGVEYERKTRVLINGQTGKIGKLPTNWLRMLLFLLSGCVIFVALLILFILVL